MTALRVLQEFLEAMCIVDWFLGTEEEDFGEGLVNK